MERKIRETFEYEGKRLIVKESKSGCDYCFFNGQRNCKCRKEISGYCGISNRSDHKSVIFVEVKNEQPQEQTEQPQKLNLCEILKHCPKGEQFWSPMLGDVKLHCIDQEAKQVAVILTSGATWEINHDATITIDEVTSPEVMLYPSREQRDWTNVKYEPKKELPKTWEEFCKQNPTKETEYYSDPCCELIIAGRDGGTRDANNDRNILPSKQAAEAHLAYMQLYQLRDAWREGWLPDWEDGEQKKYVIANDAGEFEIWEYYTISRFLAFQDEKRADEFKDCFIDLIRKAGDLI